MTNRTWLWIVGLGALVAAAHDFITGQGSLIFRASQVTKYSLPHWRNPAILEGLFFVGLAVLCIFLAIRSGDDS
jgi:hypothetical protein